MTCYARNENPFVKIGRRTVTVLVTNVVGTPWDTFEIRWDESIVENDAAVRRERFTAAISIAFRSPNMIGPITRNPLGLYVNGFTWSRESGTSDN